MVKLFTFVFTSAVLLQGALAGFNQITLGNGVAMYWGQNSLGTPGGQERLSYYCKSTDIDVFLVSFIPDLRDLNKLNFANVGPETLEEDIKECQKLGKSVLPSFGGAVTDFNGWPSSAEAEKAAQQAFAALGPLGDSSIKRPFGTAIVDGFDIDYESKMENMLAFTKELDRLRNEHFSTGGKQFYMTWAPQCVYPDEALGPLLSSDIQVDAVLVQFYNNHCGAPGFVAGVEDQPKFNFAVWQKWAETSANPSVKILVGFAATPGAATSSLGGYVPGNTAADIIAYCQRFPNFGGAMIWDASQTWANPGFLSTVRAALGGSNEQETKTLQLPKEKPSKTEKKKNKATDKPKEETSMETKPSPTTLSSVVKDKSAPAAKPTTPDVVSTTSQPTSTTEATTKEFETPTPTKRVKAARPSKSRIPLPKHIWLPGAPWAWKGSNQESTPELVRQWNQCGGADWKGGRVCEKPYVCKYFSNWYSQCEEEV